jgi:superfamily II DNA or RNA helicase
MSEIAYAINSSLTLEQGYLVLDLLEVSKEGYSYRIQPAVETRLVPQWRAMAKQRADQEAFAFLLKEELLFQQRIMGKTPHADSLPLKHLHVSPAQVLAAFKLLAATQKLYCQGKQLVIDLFGPAEFYYEGTLLKGGGLEVKGRLRWRDTDVALSECEAVGPGKPFWFVRGLTLKLIGTSLGWKRVQELKRAPLLLEGGAKQAFLEDLDPEDLDMPKLVMKEGSAEDLAQHAQPYPVLRLKDRWGACADLWMDYGHGQLVAFHDPRPLIKDAQGRPLVRRQLDAEANWEKDLLETDFIKKAVGSAHYYCPLDRVAKSLSFLLEVGWHIQDWQERQVMRQTGLALQFEDQLQTIAVKGRISYETHEADVSQVLGAFNRREHFIQLSPQTVGLISKDATQQALQDLAEESEWVGQEVRIKKSRLNTLEPLWNYATASESLRDLKDKLQNFKGIQEALPSAAFQGKLRPYQQQGVNWLAFLHGYGFHGILADEMGLGKTIQVLAFLSRLPRQGPHLIVMPTSLLFNWRNEIRQFLPSFTSVIHQGPQRARTVEELQQMDVILTSYTTLRLDLSLLQKLSYHCVILDEAQMIKNAHTQTAQAVCQLSAQLRLCLTGTPVENHLQELWSHFHFLMSDLFGPEENFEADIQAAQVDRRYLERIKRKVAPFLLRRRKQDVVADLPPRIDQVIWIDMPEEQRVVYDQLLAGFKSGLLKKVETEGIGKHRMEILEALLRLRQVCCHPLLVSSFLEENAIPVSAKFEALLQDLETIVEEGHKVLVYSQFTSMLKLMAQAAKEKQWSYGYLDGGTTNREEVVTRFQEDSSQLLFFISLRAGGVGLNLTAADYVYLYDPWWNEAVEEQAINRAHRIGRQDVVIAKRFVVLESVEEKMMKLKAAKRLMIEDLLEAETISPQLTLEDLHYLLS